MIIQNGANSMVGLSVIQIAAARGIKTINVIRGRSDYDELVERMKNYGAYIVCDDSYVRCSVSTHTHDATHHKYNTPQYLVRFTFLL